MRCVIYTRVSTEMEQQQSSLQNQRDMFTPMIEANGWELVETFVDIESGTHSKRGGLQRMMEDGIDGKFDLILAKELSRIGRNEEELMYFRGVMRKHGIHIVCLDNSIDTLTNEQDNFGLFSWIYAAESKRISRRIKASQKAKAGRGEFLGADPPYGYMREKNKLVPATDGTPEVVQRIFRMYASGHGTEYIARALTLEKIPPPSAAKGKKNAAKYWHSSSIQLMLNNRTYLGHLVQLLHPSQKFEHGRGPITPIVVENTHVPILTPELFESVQELMASKKVGPRATPKKHLFSDLLYCKDCGKRLWYLSSFEGYVCGTHKKYGSSICSGHRVVEKELEELVLADILQHINYDINPQTVTDKVIRMVERSAKQQKSALDELEKALKVTELKKGRLVLSFTNGDIGRDEYDAALGFLNEEIDGYKVRHSKLKEDVCRRDNAYFPSEIQRLASENMKNKRLSRELLHKAVRRIVVDQNSDIEIEYYLDAA